MVRTTLALSVLLAVTLAARADDRDCAGRPIPVAIRANGNVFWNNVLVTDLDLNRKFLEATARRPMPNVRLLPEKSANYKFVAHFLAKAQHFGFNCLGFQGFERAH
jgi:biopolymer transport protein ExbD